MSDPIVSLNEESLRSDLVFDSLEVAGLSVGKFRV